MNISHYYNKFKFRMRYVPLSWIVKHQWKHQTIFNVFA
jgi:hypothetical protein